MFKIVKNLNNFVHIQSEEGYKEFNRFVKKIINDAHVFFPLINDQDLSNRKPKEMMPNFLKENKHLWK